MNPYTYWGNLAIQIPHINGQPNIKSFVMATNQRVEIGGPHGHYPLREVVVSRSLKCQKQYKQMNSIFIVLNSPKAPCLIRMIGLFIALQIKRQKITTVSYKGHTTIGASCYFPHSLVASVHGGLPWAVTTTSPSLVCCEASTSPLRPSSSRRPPSCRGPLEAKDEVVDRLVEASR